MLKKHILYLLYQIKSSFSIVPRLLVCALVLTLALATVGISGNKLLNEDRTEISAKVAVVLPENDPVLRLAFGMYVSMDSMNKLASFTILHDREEALELISNKEVSAVAVLPNGFIDAILDGTSTSPELILPTDMGVESMIFSTILDAGARSLAYGQATTRTLSDIIAKYDMGLVVAAEAAAYTSSLTTHYSLMRTEFYNTIHLSQTGETTTVNYYFSSVVILMMLLSSIAITGIFVNHSPAVMESMKINGFSKGYIRFSEYLSVAFIFSLLFGVITIAGGLTLNKDVFSISLAGIFSYIIIVLSVMAFITFLCVIADSGLVSTLLIFLSSLLMIYACGRILPSVFLPDTVARIGSFLPVKHWCILYEAVNQGTTHIPSLAYSAAYGVLFFGSSVGVTYLKGRDR